MADEHRSWMYPHRDSDDLLYPEYITGLTSFMEFISRGNQDNSQLRCPCKRCKNGRFQDKSLVHHHLMMYGFVEEYRQWIYHGESLTSYENSRNYMMGESSSSRPNVCGENFNSFGDMIFDTFPQFQDSYVPHDQYFQHSEAGDVPQNQHFQPTEEPNDEARNFFESISEANKPVFGGSETTILEWCSEFLNIKAQHSISAAACNNLLGLVQKLLRPEDQSKIPSNWGSLLKLMRMLGMGHVTFDVCVNDCFLYYGVGVNYKECPICGEGRYKENKSRTGKDVGKKKLWYFPVTERLQRLYMSRKTSEHMTWHVKCQGDSDKIIHPAGGEAWKHLDRRYPTFAEEPRNVRLGLCTDGFNPFNNSAIPYSCWPVFVTPYNLPPDLMMKQQYIFLSLIISGPKSPGMNIDVLLRPLIDELYKLWMDGEVTYDSFNEQNFTMRAVLLWTISDFPAYGMLSGWSTHGKLSCPYCMEGTKSFRLKNGRKACWFDCHRQFLPIGHPFRLKKKEFFKGRVELDQLSERRDGIEMFQSVQMLPEVQFGKGLEKIDGFGVTHNWKKKSIFWELPYWSTLLIRHNLDVMHCEKNFFENLFRTIMDDPKKTKDNTKSRMDLKEYTTRKDLFLIEAGENKLIKRKAKYTVDREQRKHICEWLKSLRFPDGYVSNISRCVNLLTNHITGMKSHDCHVFMQRLIPIAFREFLPKEIWGSVTEVSLFFRSLCANVIRPADMEILQRSIIETICKLELHFPPSFFDCMEHLAIHLPYEAKVGGPVFSRWMYPFERRMHGLKSMVKNKARVEGSICEAYLNDEIANFVSHYFDRSVDTRVSRLHRNEVQWAPQIFDQLPIFIPKGEVIGKALGTRKLTSQEYEAAMLYILMNCPEVEPWVRLFDQVHGSNITDSELESRRNIEFVRWFRTTFLSGRYEIEDPRIEALARGADLFVTMFKGCTVNGFKFHTEEHGRTCTTMNSGVCVKGSTSGLGEIDYYGMLKEVINVTFSGCFPVQSIIMFKCDWYDITKGVRRHPTYHNVIDINPRFRLPTFDPFILATQASQVYYTTYPSASSTRGSRLRGLWAASLIRARHMIDISSFATMNNNTDMEQDIYQEDEAPPPVQLSVDFIDYNNMEIQLADDSEEYVEGNINADDTQIEDDDNEDDGNEDDGNEDDDNEDDEEANLYTNMDLDSD